MVAEKGAGAGVGCCGLQLRLCRLSCDWDEANGIPSGKELCIVRVTCSESCCVRFKGLKLPIPCFSGRRCFSGSKGDLMMRLCGWLNGRLCAWVILDAERLNVWKKTVTIAACCLFDLAFWNEYGITEGRTPFSRSWCCID